MKKIQKLSVAIFMVLVTACQSAPHIGVDSAAKVDAADLAAATSVLPVSHILSGKINPDGDRLTNMRALVTNDGYNNQPRFTDDSQGRFYFVAEGAKGKTDIWAYDISTDEKRQITNSTHSSEYSPKPAPGGRISFIQESPDGEMTRVHALGNEGEAAARVIDLAPLGYYEWLADGEKLAVFLRSEPPSLHIVDVASGNSQEVFGNVGRSFQASPDGMSLYVSRVANDAPVEIVRVDLPGHVVSEVAVLPTGAQDFFILFDRDGAPRSILSSDGPSLVINRISDGIDWREIANVNDMGYQSISRIAASKVMQKMDGEPLSSPHDQVVFVAHPPTE